MRDPEPSLSKNATGGPTAGDPATSNGEKPGGVFTPQLLLPGMVWVIAITVLATVLGGFAPVVGAPVFGILIGIGVALVHPLKTSTEPGLKFASKRVLQTSIVVLGFGLSFAQVLRVGAESLPVLVGSLGGVLVLAWLAGRWLRTPRDTTVLIGVGTAICGASAIAATSAAIDADDADISYAIATIFLFNVIAVLAYPHLGHLLGLSEHSFGLWAGTAINDTSSVVAAANIYGDESLSYAVVVKLTRTLAIIPITIVLAWWWTARARTNRAARRGESVEQHGRPAMRKIFPTFILAFVAAVTINSTGMVPDGWHEPFAQVAGWMITAALVAIGLSTNFREVRSAGFRPILLGGILWLSVGLLSLGLQATTGTL